MPNLNVQLTVKDEVFSSARGYVEAINIEQEVDNSDGFVELVNFSSTKATNTLSASKGFCIYNRSSVAVEIQYKVVDWKDNSNTDEANSVDLGPGSATTTRYITELLPSGSFIWKQNARMISYAEDASGANATSIDNVAPDSNLYVDSGADVDNTTASGIFGSATNTTVYLEDGHSKYFKVGDLIRCTNEIMEVTAVGTGADLANSTLTVKRGMFGSTAAGDHSDDDAVLLPFFNMTDKYNAFSTVQTDSSGRFHAKNFFGYGRTADAIADGLVPGSIAIKFYNQGYQELGMSGLNPNSKTGLAVSTAYQFTIAVDGGSAYDVDITTDASNRNFGGPNGLINKIQDVFDQQFYTSGNLFEKRVYVALINGDIRFTSGSRLSTSAVSLGDSSGGDTDLWGAGRIPALANIQGAVASKLPDDTIRDRVNYTEGKNSAVFATDDGLGNISGPASGNINYETGEINFTGPAEAHFVVSATYKSAHSGGVSTETNNFNNIQTISARSCNQKKNAVVVFKGFN